jgi:toxin ParE1/3/4
MSARRRHLTLKPRARQDLRDALLFTRERWGAAQLSRYRVRLYEAMRTLIDYPELGQSRDDLFLGCRSLRVEQHMIFYRLTETDIVVVRVLHVRQDAVGKVEP